MNHGSTYKSKILALLLLFFMGDFGAHNFYLKRTGVAVTQFILMVIAMFTILVLVGLIPLLVVEVWKVVDFLLICLDDNDNFDWSLERQKPTV